MFIGPVYPPLAPEDWQASTGDLYKQFVREFSVQGDFIAWIYHDSEWLLYADMTTIEIAPTWGNLPADDGDVYWSGPTKWVMTAGAWVVATQNLKPPPNPNPITGPESPDFPTDPPPQDGDTHTDQHGNLWWWYDGSWQTKPESQTGDIFTFDVSTDPAEKIALADVLRVIPDLDLTQLNNQKDVNWAISNAIDALDAQVEQNSHRLDDLTLLVPGSRYLYEPASVYPRPPQTGKFYLGNGFTFTEIFGNVTQILIHHTDHTGTEHTMENVDIGDSIIIEHDLDAQNFGRYQVTEVFHNFADSIITVEVVSHRGGVQADQTYDVLAFPDLNVNDKPGYDYVDQGLDTKVNRTGGDSMEGPVNITTQPGTGSRDSRRINTLGVFSNSDSSALRLGTTRDRVYVGHNDTSFNGPIKVDEIQEKNGGQGITLSDTTMINGILRIDQGGLDDVNAIEIVYGTNNLLMINGLGKMSWSADADARFMKADQEHFSLTTLSNGLAQTDFNSWMYLPESGIILGTDRNTQLTNNQLYMNGSSKNLELTGGAYIQTGRIRPAPDKFGDGISLEGQVNIGGFANMGFGMVVESDQVTVNAPIDMTSEKITNLSSPTSDQDAANKKYVDDTLETQSDINVEKYVEKSGDVMTGTLIAPRLESKIDSGEATMLVEGWVNGTASAAKITMSNKQYINAYGTIQFKGSNASGWFQFNKDIDLGTKGLHSVTRIRLVGDKAIQENNTNRILLNGKVTIPKAGSSNVDGFVIKGKTSAGNNDDLLSVYHNATQLDAVNYKGKQSAGSDNVATCKYVDNKINVATQTLAVKTWPGRRFTFKGYGLIGSALGTGIWSPSSNNNTTDIFINVEDIDGIRINQGAPDYVPGVSQTLTVYQLTDNTWTAKGFGVYGGTQTDFRSDLIKLTGFTWKQKPTLSNNTTYALHVGSMW